MPTQPDHAALNARRRGKTSHLLASTSLASPLWGTMALLAGTALGVAPAQACYTGPYPADVTGVNTCISVTNTSFTGNLINSGTVTPNGVSVATSTINGQLVNTTSGVITSGNGVNGILLQSDAVVTGGIVNQGSITGGTGANAIQLNGATFSGGIGNSGTITASSQTAITVNSSVFSGGISNSGSITSGGYGIGSFAATFQGGIVNDGTVSGFRALDIIGGTVFSDGITNHGSLLGTGSSGVRVAVPTFTGGITNSGLISGTRAIEISGVSTFAGGIVNTGTLIATGMVFAADISNVSVFSGGISNSGTVIGSVNLNAVTTFTGGITNSGSISGNINLSTVATFTGGIDNIGTLGGDIGLTTISAFSGGISNSGSLNQISFIGVTSFDGGIVNSGSVNNGVFVSFVSNFSGGINNSGTITMPGTDQALYVYRTSVFTGGITNSGTISGGYGILLGSTSAPNSISTFSGGISNSGTIIATSGVAIGITTIAAFSGGISNTGTISGMTGISVSGSAPVSVFDSGVIVGSGGTAVDLSGNSPGNVFTLGPGYAITGNVLGTGADTFQLGGAGNGTFDLASFGTQYTGFSTFNVVSATWTATGTYAPTTPVTVQGGTLLVNGDLSRASNLLVTGGTLGGIGTVGNTQINAGGTFAPGTPGSPGTAITVAGNLAFQSGALYAVQLNPATASLARVSGTATLAGTVQANFAPGAYVSKQYTILTAAGGLGGTTFSGLTNTGLPQGAADTLSYDANDVYLNLKAGFSQYTGLNGNQQAVANALTGYFNSNGGIPARFFGLSPGGLTQVDGEAATGAEQAALRLTSQFLNLMLDPFVYGRSGDAGTGAPGLGFAPDAQATLPPDVALAYAGIMKAPPPASFAQRWTAWGGAYGGGSKISGDPVAGSSDLTADTYGVAAGADYHVSRDTILGFALAGGGTNWGLSGGLGGGRSDAFQAGGYGITRAGPAYVAGAVSFTNHWFSTSRTALGDQLTGRYQGQSYGARLEGGYRFALQPWLGVTPYAALQAQEFSTAAYNETDVTGGGFGLNYASMHASDVRGELGVRLDDPTMLGGMPLVLRGRLAYAHDTVGNPALSAAFQTLPGASFIVNGAPIPKDSALMSAGAQLFITSRWSLLAKFDGEFASGAQSYAGSGTLRYTW